MGFCMDENSECIQIFEVEQTLSGVMKISTTDGPVFFIRSDFLESVDVDRIRPGEKFNREETEDILNAGLVFAAERKAEDYLARCEQCRFGLERKLVQKNFDSKSVKRALDYLEQRNFLSDERFARSWLRSHLNFKAQGKIRVSRELISRGISKAVCDKIISEFFEENDEEEFCRKAFQKAKKVGKNGEKLLKYMFDQGFSYRMIQKVQREVADCE